MATTCSDVLDKHTTDEKVLDESRSFFRVHTGYFSNIPKCIKAEFIASWACSQSSVVSSSSVRINLIVCLIELCTSFELRDKFGGSAGNGGAHQPSEERLGEDPLKWLKEYDRVANFNKWDDMTWLTFISFLTELRDNGWDFLEASQVIDCGQNELVLEDICRDSTAPDAWNLVSPTERRIIHEEVQKMLDEGIVQPSESPWSSPIVLVRKKKTVVGVFASIIANEKDVYPLPRIDDNCLKGAMFFSSNLRSGYWQIEIDEADREKTAFITPKT
ncbi:retrovirus-related Pol polyprotein from transposon 297 [Trichonephila clavipes]|nr:retrovirus-related Pol polyprotein from transposon 297 [Trichonephila clavipes]